MLMAYRLIFRNHQVHSISKHIAGLDIFSRTEYQDLETFLSSFVTVLQIRLQKRIKRPDHFLYLTNFCMIYSAILKQDRIIVLGTRGFIQKFSSCEIWLINGTFKTCPLQNEPFSHWVSPEHVAFNPVCQYQYLSY